MTDKTLRRLLIFWTLFIGIGALGGGSAMLIEPTGKVVHFDELLPYFQVLPFAQSLFQNFIFPGCMLILFNCLTQLVTFVLLMKKNPLAIPFGMGCGVILMLWICIQFIIFPLNIMSTLYFIFGALEFTTALVMYKRGKAI